MKYNNFFQYFLANWCGGIGGFIVGFSLPFGSPVITDNNGVDFLILCPIGLLLMAASYYYKFIKEYPPKTTITQ